MKKAGENLTQMEWIKFQEIRQSLGGIERTEAEEKTLAWIATCEPETINNLIHIFYKLRLHPLFTEGR